MTGYHIVRQFQFSHSGQFASDQPEGLTLPVGWKPFAVTSDEFGTVVWARKWCRAEDNLLAQDVSRRALAAELDHLWGP